MRICSIPPAHIPHRYSHKYSHGFTDVLKQVCSSGAPGVDEICPEFLKALDVVGLSWLTRLQVDIRNSASGVVDWDGWVCSMSMGSHSSASFVKVYSRVHERRV